MSPWKIELMFPTPRRMAHCVERGTNVCWGVWTGMGRGLVGRTCMCVHVYAGGSVNRDSQVDEERAHWVADSGALLQVLHKTGN